MHQVLYLPAHGIESLGGLTHLCCAVFIHFCLLAVRILAKIQRKFRNVIDALYGVAYQCESDCHDCCAEKQCCQSRPQFLMGDIHDPESERDAEVEQYS